jgi:large subunit ribosomal protein L15
LQQAIDAGRLGIEAPVNAATLVASGILRRAGDGVRLLAEGKLTSAITIEVAGASEAAIAAVEATGGKVIVDGAAKAEGESGAAPA